MGGERRKQRKTFKTLLIFGEGKTEGAFTNFIKDLFVGRDCGLRVSVDSGKGGDPASVLKSLCKKLHRITFNDCVVLMDKDRPWPDCPPKKINKTKITYIATLPCIEGLFLRLLNDKKCCPDRRNSRICEKHFHQNYLNRREKCNKESYNKIFSKEDLLNASQVVSELAQLLSFLGAYREGKGTPIKR